MKYDPHQLLDEEQYWKIIEMTRDAGGQRRQYAKLYDILCKSSPDEILQFYLRTDQLLFQAHTPLLWDAATIMNRGWCSTDGFVYFKTWLISKGKQTYYEALKNPDTLTRQVNPKTRWYDFESFRYAAPRAYSQLTCNQLWEHFPKDFPFSEGKSPKITSTIDTDNPEAISKVLPNLHIKMQRVLADERNGKYRGLR